jgi:hypothetical protein
MPARWLASRLLECFHLCPKVVRKFLGVPWHLLSLVDSIDYAGVERIFLVVLLNPFWLMLAPWTLLV